METVGRFRVSSFQAKLRSMMAEPNRFRQACVASLAHACTRDVLLLPWHACRMPCAGRCASRVRSHSLPLDAILRLVVPSAGPLQCIVRPHTEAAARPVPILDSLHAHDLWRPSSPGLRRMCAGPLSSPGPPLDPACPGAYRFPQCMTSGRRGTCMSPKEAAQARPRVLKGDTTYNSVC